MTIVFFQQNLQKEQQSVVPSDAAKDLESDQVILLSVGFSPLILICSLLMLSDTVSWQS